MKIVKCTEADVDLLTKFNKCLIEDEKSDNKMNVDELYQRMKTFITSEYDAYFFKEGEDVIGYALVKNNCEPLYLRQFYIDRMYRRKQYGQQAFEALLKHLGVSTIDIEVLSWNEAGIRFWEKLGFRERSRYMRFGG